MCYFAPKMKMGRTSSLLLGVYVSSSIGIAACIRERTTTGCSKDSDCGANDRCDSGTSACISAKGEGGSAGGGGMQSGGGAASTGGVSGMSSGGSSDHGGENATGGVNASGGSAGSTTGGTGGAITSAGGAAAGGTSGATSSSKTDMIDDLEDGDGRILQLNGRQGPWHTFNSGDSGGTQTPAGPTLIPVPGGANESTSALHFTGKGYMFAGIGFDLNNADAAPESAQSKAYEASSWTGVAFMAKGGATDSAKLRIEIPMRDFVPSDRGGTCSGTCWNVHGFQMPNALSSSWQEVKVPFSSLVREDGAKTPAFDAKQIMSISFKHHDAPFDFWIDDVRFYKD
jgi:hypothetical protein